MRRRPRVGGWCDWRIVVLPCQARTSLTLRPTSPQLTSSRPSHISMLAGNQYIVSLRISFPGRFDFSAFGQHRWERRRGQQTDPARDLPTCPCSPEDDTSSRGKISVTRHGAVQRWGPDIRALGNGNVGELGNDGKPSKKWIDSSDYRTTRPRSLPNSLPLTVHLSLLPGTRYVVSPQYSVTRRVIALC
ncbi:hypothetical protein EDD18DRAFT_1206629 [Armillaria luteobubalina]|uniref:Uncharacterized protein n=1 Tax=Armillaria luteobubalina TaxID=153913 RepID=A0AA39P9S6_9AGAR|nr:hypothetical protein EDD18DRAFT_1206629 [Armillaria luteobubalina]